MMNKNNIFSYKPFGINFNFIDPDKSTYRETLPGSIYEPAVSEILKRIIEKEKGEAIFLDIGSLYGYFSCYCAKIDPNCKVYAFEPELNYCKYIYENINLNRLSNVTVCDVALSDKKESMLFKEKTLISKRNAFSYVSKNNTLSNNASSSEKVSESIPAKQHSDITGIKKLMSLFQLIAEITKKGIKDFISPPKTQAVNCLKYDDWEKENNIRANISKIDVHGAEVKVLRGMKDSLKNGSSPDRVGRLL